MTSVLQIPDFEPAVEIIPLGGLGEIGLNMLLFKYGEEILVIDAGLMFPEDYMLGIDIAIPDFSYLLRHKDQVRAVVLTHGHEDHIGALPFLLRETLGPGVRFPVYPGVASGKIERTSTLRTDGPAVDRAQGNPGTGFV